MGVGVGRRRAFSPRDLRASNERVHGVCIYYGWRVENSVDFPPDMWIFGMEYRIGDKFGAGVEVNFREQFIFG